MKRIYLSFFLIAALFTGHAQSKLTIAAGAWNNPAIWFPSGVPTGGETNILIQHAVTFTGLLGIGPDSLLISTNGCLTGTSGFDTLSTGATQLTNQGGISVTEFITSDDFLNYGRVKVTQNFNQGGNFWNYQGAKVDVGQLFNSSDSLLNDGEIKAGNWNNSAPCAGTGGKFCIANCFVNTSLIGGNIDICDATPATFCDINSGAIAPSVTYCVASPCTGVSTACTSTGMADQVNVAVIGLFPNPASGQFTVTLSESLPAFFVTVYDVTGKRVAEVSSSGSKTLVKLPKEISGLLFVEVRDNQGRILTTKKLIAE